MSRPTQSYFPLIVLTLLAGCAAPAPDAPADAPSLQRRLRSGAVVSVSPALSQGRVDVRLPIVEHVPSRLPLPVLGGRAFLQTAPDDTLVLHDLTVLVGDAHLPPQRLPPRGLTIASIHIALADPTPFETEWLGDNELFASTRADLLLDWSMVLRDGSEHHLAQERLEGARIDVHAFLDADGDVVTTTDVVLDEVHHWAGLVTLSNLSLELDASER